MAEAVQENVAKVRGMTRMTTGMDVTLTVLNGLLIVVHRRPGAVAVEQGRITVGAIALATGLVIRIDNMSGWIMWVVNGIFEDIGTVQDGMETVAKPQCGRRRRATPHPGHQPRRSANSEDIHFHYGKQGGVIAGLELHVRPGEKIGLIGPSGAGKSTLVNVLLRLYDLEGGRILHRRPGHRRRHPGEPARADRRGHPGHLAAASLDPRQPAVRASGCQRGEVRAAVRSARADGFIAELVDGEGRRGYDAQVGERGVKLSGGQRQRIAIARVLLKDAPILVLDEATSALDSEVEAAIQDSLDMLMQGKTVIAIAHRLSTIARMDRLVVMDKGEIVETGTHAELIAQRRPVCAPVGSARPAGSWRRGEAALYRAASLEIQHL